jgi:hypothetical protein
MLMRRMAAGSAALVAMAWCSVAVADVVTCESSDGQRQYCRAETRNSVWLQTQLSRAPCRLGDSWGYDANGIWTANGCRARFQTGSSHQSGGSGSYGSSGSSQSGGNNAAAAVAALAIVAAGAAAVHHHHEKERRDDNRNDYYRDDYYNYDYRPQQSYGYNRYGGSDETLRCESEDGRRRFCPVDTRGSRVELTRQMSRSQCQFARNWGYDRNGVWVNGGCRAEFTVYRN